MTVSNLTTGHQNVGSARLGVDAATSTLAYFRQNLFYVAECIGLRAGQWAVTAV